MPELPEVETVRRGLERVAIGHRVTAVEVSGARTVRRQPRAEFTERLRGRTLTRARRHGKYLLVDLDDGGALLVHLRMSGQLRHVTAEEPTAPHTHAVAGLDDGSELRFVDPRTFGELFVTADLDAAGWPRALPVLGPDALTDPLGRDELARLLSRRRTSLKAFLLDQRAVAGIGSIYADEICASAGLRPARRTDSLRGREVGRLVEAIPTVLTEAVVFRGSSLRDGRYADLFGAPGGYQARHVVHDRAGTPCDRCQAPIERVRVAGRSAYFCPRCQR